VKVSARRGEGAVAGCLVLVAAYILYTAWAMPSGTGGQPGPGFVPFGIGLVLLVSGLALLVRAWRGAAPAASAVELGHARIWVTLAALVAAAYALEPVGYLITSALLLGVLLRAYGPVRWPVTIAGAVVGAGASWLFFDTLLGVSLPAGLLAMH